MIFSREVYLETNFLHLLFPLATGFVLLFGSLYISIVQVINKRNRKNPGYVWKKIISGLFGFFLGAAITFYIGSILIKDGGIFLPFETEREAVVLSGKVEQIEDRKESAFNRYSINESPGYSWGNYVTIDGIRYSVVAWTDIQVGEVVTIVCLPKSRCILSYTKAA